MKAICKTKCYYQDKIWEPGETIDLAPEQEKEDSIQSYFILPEEPKLAPKKEKK